MTSNRIAFPRVDSRGGMPLNRALALRRSVRDFGSRELTIPEIGQLLWAGQGRSSARGLRTAPSAGALYPIELHLVIPTGVYRYSPEEHGARQLADGDRRPVLARAALGQGCVAKAAACIVVAGAVARTAVKYGPRAERYMVFEAGAASQNILLEAVSLKIGAVVVGAYDDDAVRSVAELPRNSAPLAIIAVGAAK